MPVDLFSREYIFSLLPGDEGGMLDHVSLAAGILGVNFWFQLCDVKSWKDNLSPSLSQEEKLDRQIFREPIKELTSKNNKPSQNLERDMGLQ